MLSSITTNWVTLWRCRVQHSTRQRLFQPRYANTNLSVEWQHNNSVLLRYPFNSQGFTHLHTLCTALKGCNSHAREFSLPGRQLRAKPRCARTTCNGRCTFRKLVAIFLCAIDAQSKRYAGAKNSVCTVHPCTAVRGTCVLW